ERAHFRPALDTGPDVGRCQVHSWLWLTATKPNEGAEETGFARLRRSRYRWSGAESRDLVVHRGQLAAGSADHPPQVLSHVSVQHVAGGVERKQRLLARRQENHQE